MSSLSGWEPRGAKPYALKLSRHTRANSYIVCQYSMFTTENLAIFPCNLVFFSPQGLRKFQGVPTFSEQTRRSYPVRQSAMDAAQSAVRLLLTRRAPAEIVVCDHEDF
jgi:hypothetical protein